MSAKLAYSMDADLIETIDWEALSPWTQNQLVGLLAFCQQRGWTPCHIGESLSRTLEPILSVWQITIEIRQKFKTIWMINGDLPIDFIPYNNVPTARDALLHFSRKFLSRAQAMKRQAETLPENQLEDKDKLVIQQLVKAAADLLVLYHEDEVWTE